MKAVKIAGDEIAGDGTPIKELQKMAHEYARKNLQGKKFTNADTGWQISISRASLDKTLSHSAKREQAQSIPALPELLREALWAQKEAPQYPGNKDIRWYHTFYAPLQIGDTLHMAKLVVRETNMGHRFYDHNLTKIEKPVGNGQSLPSTNEAPSESTGSDINIRDLPHNVNKNVRESRAADTKAPETTDGLAPDNANLSIMDPLKAIGRGPCNPPPGNGLSQMKRVLALDVGDKRTGAAISDALGITAQPLGVHERTGYKSDLEWICGFMKEYDIGHIVVGLPLNMNGSKGERALAAERYAEKLRADTGLEVSLWDERMTTMEAERFLIETGMSRMKRKKKIDQTAASLILSGWLSANAWPKNKTGGMD